MKKQAGFSLLEAIVAMALLATAGLALFTWINQSFLDLSRVQAANARALAETNALQFIQTINPMKTPSGSTELGSLKIEWKSRALTERRSNLSEIGEPGPFFVALYEMEVSLEQAPDVARDTFLIRQLGFERAPYQSDPFSVGVTRPGAKGAK